MKEEAEIFSNHTDVENINNLNIVFKANKDGIVIILPENIPFNELKSNFNKKVLGSRNFFGNARTKIIFKGRNLSELEEKELLGLMYRYTDLDIILTKREEQGLSLIITEPEVSSTKKEITEEEREIEGKNKNVEIKKIKIEETKIEETAIGKLEIKSKEISTFHHGSLRSGQSIEKEGSLVLIGDVNPGAEIKVSGNVVVLGTISGLVHAGNKGDRNCTISALKFGSSQIRIAEIISHIPEVWSAKQPSHAYIEDDQIFISPLI